MADPTRTRDRELLDVAVDAHGDVVGLATWLHVDPPAIAAWRESGIPPELRAVFGESLRPGSHAA